jgi:branched-chain amino acid transport system permease protein
MRPRLILALFAVVLALLAIIPGVPPFWITLLNNIGLAALVAIGLVLLTGVGGMTSFGQAAFCGFGAYTTAILTTTYGLSPWLSLPVALAVTGVAAVLLGLITVRLSGHYLPLGTLAWGISLYFLFGKIDLLGRNDGISGIPPLSIGPWSLIDPKATYWVIWIFVLLAGIGTSNLLSSRIGRAIRALRRGGVAAESFGVERMRVKLVVFVYAALLAGLSGWLYAHLQRSVNPTPFGLGAGIEYLLMATFGGAGHVWGGLLGAGVVVILKDALQRILPAALGSDLQAESIVFGIVLVATLQVAREGLWPYLAALFPAPAPIAAPADAKPLVRRAAAADV